VPKYGLKFKFNHKFPDKQNFNQNLKPSWKQLWNLMPMMLRYVPYYWKSSKGGSMVLMDYFAMRNHDGIYGCPMGGIAGENFEFLWGGKKFLFDLRKSFEFVFWRKA
jgi:hypothetical protein